MKEHEDLYQAAISDTNKSMCGAAARSPCRFTPCHVRGRYDQEGPIMKEKMCQVIEDWGRNVQRPAAHVTRHTSQPCTLSISIMRLGFSRNIIAQVLLATGEVPDLPDDEDGGSLEILKPPPPAVEGGDVGADAKGKGKGDDKKKDKKKEKGEEEGGQDGLKSAFVPNIR